MRKFTYFAFFLGVVLLLAVACNSEIKDTLVPTVSLAPAPTVITTPYSQLTREEKILTLAKERPGYYDKTDTYLDLVGFHPEDLPNCTVSFLSVIIDGKGTVIEQHDGLATVMGEKGEHIIVPSFLVPVIPSAPPTPLPPIPGSDFIPPQVTKEDLATWTVFMALMTKDANISLAFQKSYPELRVATLSPLDTAKPLFDKFIEKLPSTCQNLEAVGVSTLLAPMDFLMIAGFLAPAEKSSAPAPNVAPIDGRVRAVSEENKGFYFRGTILPEDMGGLVFAFRFGKPEIVGIVTGGNWPLGYETFNFATNFDDVLSAVSKESGKP